LLHPEKFVKLGIDPPKGVLCYGPPGTGKTLSARAVANRTDACFIRVIGSELVQKYVGEGARLVRELFQMARSKKACLIFFDEVDAIGGARFDDGQGGDNEVQRTMLEIVNQLDGFDARGNIKVLMATNRPDTLDPALLRPGRLDRKVEFGLPDLESRTQIFKIHTRSMAVERDIRYELLARLCPNATGAEIHSVCTEGGHVCHSPTTQNRRRKGLFGRHQQSHQGLPKVLLHREIHAVQLVFSRGVLRVDVLF
jgi:26S proteasome regulatory subunit T1